MSLLPSPSKSMMGVVQNRRRTRRRRCHTGPCRRYCRRRCEENPAGRSAKAPLIVPAAAWIARIDRGTASDQSMRLGRAAIIFQGAQDLRSETLGSSTMSVGPGTKPLSPAWLRAPNKLKLLAVKTDSHGFLFPARREPGCQRSSYC